MVSATVRITTDNHYKLFVNGALVDAVQRIWSDPQSYTTALFRHPSRKNVIAIEGLNTTSIDGLDRGILADVRFDAGGARMIVTDTSWKMTSALSSTWADPAFDDGAWAPAVDQGPHGIAPWNAVLGTSSAHWIWTYLSSGTAASKGTNEYVYARRTFYLGVDGAVKSASSPCP